MGVEQEASHLQHIAPEYPIIKSRNSIVPNQIKHLALGLPFVLHRLPYTVLARSDNRTDCPKQIVAGDLFQLRVGAAVFISVGSKSIPGGGFWVRAATTTFLER